VRAVAPADAIHVYAADGGPLADAVPAESVDGAVPVS
jgi:hypothetical protein